MQTRFHPRGGLGTVRTLLKCWQAWVKVRSAFGGHFSWQAQFLMNLDDVLTGSKMVFCETVAEFDLGHDDDSVWRAQDFGCLGLNFRGAQYFVDFDKK